MIQQVNYITQEKSKSEDLLISSVTLLKKNIKDYNELLLFSSKLAANFLEIYDDVKAEKTKDPSKTIRIPFKESQVAQYRELKESELKHIRKELNTFVNAHSREITELSCPLVSSPSKYVPK